METSTTLKDWIPFLSSLVTPIFVVLLILWFHKDVGDFVSIIKTVVGEQQRSLEIGDWFKIGERARTTEIKNLGLGDISVTLSEHDYEEWVIEKGSEALLYELREKSQQYGGRPVDVMVLKDGIRYFSKVLEKYIAKLGIKYVLFIRGNTFEYWIPAGLFVGQLMPHRTYTYDELSSEILGLRSESALPSATASNVLKLMQDKQTDYVAIVDKKGLYRYMVSKQDILAKLVTAIILQTKEGA